MARAALGSVVMASTPTGTSHSVTCVTFVPTATAYCCGQDTQADRKMHALIPTQQPPLPFPHHVPVTFLSCSYHLLVTFWPPSHHLPTTSPPPAHHLPVQAGS